MDLITTQIFFSFCPPPPAVDLHYVAISDGIENQNDEEGEPTPVKRNTISNVRGSQEKKKKSAK